MPNRRQFERIVPTDGTQAYSMLLLLCGVAMLFAIPFASRVWQHSAFRSFFVPSMFFFAYAFLMTVLGMARGSAIARDEQRLPAALTIAGQVSLGQLLVLPYLIYVRAVLRASEPRIALVALYTCLVAYLAGLLGHSMETRALRRQRPALFRKIAVVLAYYVVPFALDLAIFGRAGLLSLVSPIGAVLHILDRGAALTTAFAFMMPTVALVLCLLRIWRHSQEASG